VAAARRIEKTRRGGASDEKDCSLTYHSRSRVTLQRWLRSDPERVESRSHSLAWFFGRHADDVPDQDKNPAPELDSAAIEPL
jgi:hypothetical protein